MDKRLFLLIVPVLLLASCQREIDWSGAPEIKATVETESKTRTSLSVDESGAGTVYWNPADQIDVFFDTKKAGYISQNTSDAASAVFKTTAILSDTDLMSTNIWGLYPSNSSSSCNGSSITTTLPSTQYGVPNTFDDDLFLAVAHSTTTSLQFYNVCGGIKFNLAYDDIKKVTFRGNNDEDLAGTVSISFEDGLPKATVVNGVKEITLTPKTGATFTKGADYYITLLPGTLDAGFSMSFTASDGTAGDFFYFDNPVTIKRSVFSRKGNMDVYAMFADERQPNNVIYYTSSDGQIVTPYRTDDFGANIVSNEYVDGRGVLSFDGEVTGIGGYAFYYCIGLTSITMPNSVTSIGNSSFYHCSGLTNIEIPASVKSIGYSAFYQCTGLTSINIPYSVTLLSGNPFAGCSGLVSIVVDPSNNNYDSRNSCNAIINSATNELITGCKSSVIPESVTGIGNSSFYQCIGLTSIAIPNSVTSIGNSSFYHCIGLTNIEIPASVKSIGSSAFYQCTGLTSINIPYSVTLLSGNPFAGCSGLVSIVVDPSNNNYDSRNSCNAIINSATNELITGCKSSVIPESVAGIGNSAFYECSGLRSIAIPSSVTSIGNSAFHYCIGLTSIAIPNSITSIGDYAFYYCSLLRSVDFPNSLTSIGIRAFDSCRSLASIELPKSILNIGDQAFYFCDGLVSVTVYATSPPVLGNEVFEGTNNCPIYFPAGSVVDAAKSAWGAYSDRIQAILRPDNVLFYTSSNGEVVSPFTTSVFGSSIISNEYVGGKGILTFDRDITRIGSQAFSHCHELSSISVPSSVLEIGSLAFDDCPYLLSITINAISPPLLGDCAFEQTNDCPIYVPANSVVLFKTSWKDYADRIQAIPHPNNVIYYTSSTGTVIPPRRADVFGANIISNEYVDGRGIITFDGDVTSIGYEAFHGKRSLTSIELPNTVTSIGYLAFDGTGLTSIDLPCSVTSINAGSNFSHCKGLKSIRIPSSVTHISGGLFYESRLESISVDPGNPNYDSRNNCNAIIETSTNRLINGCSETVIPESVTSIGSGAFESSGLTNIVIPNSVTSIGRGAFDNCSCLTSIEIPYSVTSIGNYGFFGCSGLSSIEIPNSVTTIGEAAFSACGGLSSIVVDSGNTNYDSRNNCNAIINSSSNELIAGCKSTILPNSVTKIGAYAFYQCSSLTSIDIPNSVTSIGNDAFGYCTGLTTIEIPSSVTVIGASAFTNCSNLKSVYFHTISPHSMDDSAFSYCNGCLIFVPAVALDSYKSAWSNYANQIYAISEDDSHEAVDLGLSVKWATSNVGALYPQDPGFYFAWGEISQKDVYSWPSYIWCNGSYNSLTKYNDRSALGNVDNKISLDSSDDAATVIWGSSWRIPTKDELDELLENCTWTWTTKGGINGYLITSNLNGNSIFLPAAGMRNGNGIINVGSNGYYWSSSSYSTSSYDVSFYSKGAFLSRDYRYYGLPIRPVKE